MLQRTTRSATPGLAAALAAIGVLGLLALVPAVVWTHLGQRADERSRWSVAVPGAARAVLLEWLGLVSLTSLAVAVAVAVVLALARRRPGRALAVAVLVAGANASTQILKVLLPRPVFGGGLDLDNSLPSGHTTAIVSLVLALVLVVPRGARPAFVLAGSAAATLTGAAVLLERWHRPSDVLAAYGVCAVWGGLALGLAHVVHRRGAAVEADAPAPRTGRFALLSLTGAALVGGWLIAAGLVAHAEPGSTLVGAVVLSAIGVGSGVLVTLFASGADALRRLR